MQPVTADYYRERNESVGEQEWVRETRDEIADWGKPSWSRYRDNNDNDED